MSNLIQLGFQDRASPIMEEFDLFHDMVIIILIFILGRVARSMAFTLTNKLNFKTLIARQNIEWVWTIIPGAILILIAIPSLKLLYMYDELDNMFIRIKAVGHQWYWRYEMRWGGRNQARFDSYIRKSPVFRVLDTDSRVSLPLLAPSQVYVTSEDVLHAWTVPRMGVKVDAVPGRLNSLSLLPCRRGVFYGQCSEICGANHSFIPISVEVLPANKFIVWFWNLVANS